MALQLGSLRDALLSANVPADKADKAAEEVAGYENRLTELTTLTRVSVGIVTALLLSQVLLWVKLGEVSGQLTQLSAQVTRVAR